MGMEGLPPTRPGCALSESKASRGRSGFHKVAGWPGRGSVGGGSFRVMKTYTSSSSSPEASPAVATMRPEGLPAGVEGPPAGPDGAPAGRGWLDAAVANLATLDPAQEPDAALATGTLAAERLGDRLDAARLRLLAAVDARGAAGAEHGTLAPTAGWLRANRRLSPALAAQRVRTARALHRGPLRATARALAAGEVSYAHAAALADATSDLPPARVAEAEPVLVDAAARLDPPRLRRLADHLRELVDPDGTEQRGRARLEQRGLRLSGTVDGMVDVKGLLDPEAGEAIQAALAPLARPTGPDDGRSAAQRRADALGELARRALQAGGLPKAGGLRPNLTVTVEWASLRNQHGGLGGTGGWGGVLPPETVRRLACDAAVVRAVVRRHPQQADAGHAGATANAYPASPDGSTTDDGALAAELRAAIGLLPPPLGAPVELLDLGRATRAIPPALRRALALRDGGCAAAGCDRPPPQWADAHH